MLLMLEGHQIFSATFDARLKIYFTITFHHASLNRKMGFNSNSKQTNTVRFRRTYLVLIYGVIRWQNWNYDEAELGARWRQANTVLN